MYKLTRTCIRKNLPYVQILWHDLEPNLDLISKALDSLGYEPSNESFRNVRLNEPMPDGYNLPMRWGTSVLEVLPPVEGYNNPIVLWACGLDYLNEYDLNKYDRTPLLFATELVDANENEPGVFVFDREYYYGYGERHDR